MSSDSSPALIARNVTKRYRIFPGPLARLRDLMGRPSPHVREFVALEGVTFDVAPGTCLGLVGPNGAGKSTLLKILAGIIEPTTGEAASRGRIASIIELGAGFHPEFTGRQNVLMNAVLHGLTQHEAESRIDEIARFSELGRYFDMPVRTYSSGMFVRLAFSLATSVDPEILLVDEALAVGDAVFVHRCLARIRQLRESGTTIVLVTHDTSTVASLCDRAMLVLGGRVEADGHPKDVIHKYLLHVAERLTHIESDHLPGQGFHVIGATENSTENLAEQRFGNFDARIVVARVEDANGKVVSTVMGGAPIRLRMVVRFEKPADDPVFGVMIRNRFGVELFGTNTHIRQEKTGRWNAGDLAEVTFDLAAWFDGGAYAASFAVHTAEGKFFDYRVDARVFEVAAAKDSIGLVRVPTQARWIKTDVLDGQEQLIDDSLTRAFPDAPQSLCPGAANAKQYMTGDWDDTQNGSAASLGSEGRVFLRVPAASKRLVLTARSLTTEPAAVEAWCDGVYLGANSAEPEASSTPISYQLPTAPGSKDRVCSFFLRTGVDSDSASLVEVHQIETLP